MEPIVVDLETTTTHDHIWCAGTYDLATGVAELFFDSEKLKEKLFGRDVIAHNGIKFDFPVLRDVWGVVVPPSKMHDTYLMSVLHNPNIEGGHSLAVWGERLGFAKLDFEFEDFDAGYTDDMGTYCLRDCELTGKLYEELQRRLQRDGFSENSVRLEHRVGFVTKMQEEHGFLLDLDHATNVFTQHVGRMSEIEDVLQELFPPIITERYSEKTGKRLNDGVEVFNVGSRQQVARRLEGLGAKWKTKTETGLWQVNEKTLGELNMPEADMVAEYLTLQKRSGMVDSWIAAVQDDGRVHGRVQTCGAVTRRMTHSSPNMAQIPADALYRQCWTVPDGYVLIGCDASQLELRLLAHYMQDDEYIDQILNGDIHSYNQHLAGLSTRDQAKTFIYALIYGAGDAKIGEIVGGTAADGKELKRQFFAMLPAYSRLKAKVEGIVEDNGVLPCLDGGRVRVRHQHAAMNTLLQCGGAVVMKQAVASLADQIMYNTIPAHLVAQVHDEFQIETRHDFGLMIGEMAVRSIEETTHQLNLRCPMAAEYKLGATWAETH